MNEDRRVALEALGMEWSPEKRAPLESYYRPELDEEHEADRLKDVNSDGMCG